MNLETKSCTLLPAKQDGNLGSLCWPPSHKTIAIQTARAAKIHTVRSTKDSSSSCQTPFCPESCPNQQRFARIWRMGRHQV